MECARQSFVAGRGYIGGDPHDSLSRARDNGLRPRTTLRSNIRPMYIYIYTLCTSKQVELNKTTLHLLVNEEVSYLPRWLVMSLHAPDDVVVSQDSHRCDMTVVTCRFQLDIPRLNRKCKAHNKCTANKINANYISECWVGRKWKWAKNADCKAMQTNLWTESMTVAKY